MKLADALRQVSVLGIDTPILIYFVEKNPTYLERVREVIRLVDEGAIVGRSSAIALTEVLTVPIRAGDAGIAADYKDLLLHSRNFALTPIDVVVADLAADIRARFNLKTPDALHVAGALNSGCDVFLTNDNDLRRVTDIPILILDDLAL